jgi:hypothetical protein
MSIMAKTDRFDRRNPVDLEFDHFRGFAVDHADAAEPFGAHRQVDDHVHGIVIADRHPDFGCGLAIDEIDQAVLRP